LLVPKRSTLKSRSEVDLNREYVFFLFQKNFFFDFRFIFKHSKQHYNGTPVVASVRKKFFYFLFKNSEKFSVKN